MSRLLWLSCTVLTFLSACAHKPVTQTSGTDPHPPAIATDADQMKKAISIREEGLQLLYSKDPRVKDAKKSFEKLQEAANLGDPVAMDSVGGFYSAGLGGVEKSCPKAMEWFEKSAAAGYGLAANNLAYLYVTCADKKLRDTEKSEQIMKMMFLNNPSFLAVLDTYAAVLAEQGNFKQAGATMQVVIDLLELVEFNPQRIDESKKTLALYKKRKKLAP